MTAYMTVEGNNQGNIEGDCTQSGREKTHLVYDVKHTIEIPRDNLTGLPTGQRLHKPYTVTTHFSKGVPQLYQMCCTGEQGTVEVKYFQIDDKGQEQHYFTIKLESAIIVNISHDKPMVFVPENKPYKDMVSVEFSYSKITWTQEVDGVTADDDWTAPK
jgi:type VI secretion system secreted protein Hcp